MRNSTLTELDLRNNGISPSGGAVLGEMLAKNTHLKRIDLRWNNLGASGGKAILDGLQRNGSMIELLLAGNKVSDETLRLVDQTLHKVSAIVRICALAYTGTHWNVPACCAEPRPCG